MRNGGGAVGVVGVTVGGLVTVTDRWGDGVAVFPLERGVFLGLALGLVAAAAGDTTEVGESR